MAFSDPVILQQLSVSLEEEITDLTQAAAALRDAGRLSARAYMCLILGMGCLKRASEHPEQRDIGAGLDVTITDAKKEVRHGSNR